jgi:hypothetical protein
MVTLASSNSRFTVSHTRCKVSALVKTFSNFLLVKRITGVKLTRLESTFIRRSENILQGIPKPAEISGTTVALH